MGRTQELQEIIQSRMGSVRYNNVVVPAYVDEAPDSATVPYIIYNINSFSYEDKKEDVILEVDIWDEGANYQRVEAIADTVEPLFDKYVYHSPTKSVIPQFFRYIRTKVPDTDKKVKRINLKFEIQNYAHTVHVTSNNNTEANNG